MTVNSKTSRADKRKAMIKHIEKNEAFLKEILGGKNLNETVEKYGKKFIAPIPAPKKK